MSLIYLPAGPYGHWSLTLALYVMVLFTRPPNSEVGAEWRGTGIEAKKEEVSAKKDIFWKPEELKSKFLQQREKYRPKFPLTSSQTF